MRSDLARLTLLHPGIVAAQREVQDPVAEEEEHALQTNEKKNRNVILGERARL